MPHLRYILTVLAARMPNVYVTWSLYPYLLVKLQYDRTVQKLGIHYDGIFRRIYLYKFEMVQLLNRLTQSRCVSLYLALEAAFSRDIASPRLRRSGSPIICVPTTISQQRRTSARSSSLIDPSVNDQNSETTSTPENPSPTSMSSKPRGTNHEPRLGFLIFPQADPI